MQEKIYSTKKIFIFEGHTITLHEKFNLIEQLTETENVSKATLKL